MHNSKHTIPVFEYQSLKVGYIYNDIKFEKKHLQALERFYGEKGVPYFKLIHNGIKFNEYVGVIQVDNITIEVLPKADKDDTLKKWREMLIGMLRTVGIFKLHAPSSASLRIKSNSILDLYFELFLDETEYLLHKGLVKRYHKIEGNRNALRGSLKFAKHIHQNLVHQERFYVKYTAYDKNQILNCILYKTIRLLKQINNNALLMSRIGALLLDFPEMPDIEVTDSSFNKITYNRKTEDYKNAIEIARLLLLNYHPDISTGQNHVLALMFDMNLLWEKFIYVSLRKQNKSNRTITEQTSKGFWKPENGYKSKIKPDIIIDKEKGKELTIVLDTKWKNLGGKNPSPDDLRQLYVYHKYYSAKKVALVYPGVKDNTTGGIYLHHKTGNETNKECSVITIQTKPNIKEWQDAISDQIENWISSS